MTREEPIKEVVLRLIKQVAPEADVANLQPDMRLRDQLDLDSVDFMNFAVALQENFKVEIPEMDFFELGTLNGCIRYFVSRGVSGHFPPT
jgi:acyl carrier protein